MRYFKILKMQSNSNETNEDHLQYLTSAFNSRYSNTIDFNSLQQQQQQLLDKCMPKLNSSPFSSQLDHKNIFQTLIAANILRSNIQNSNVNNTNFINFTPLMFKNLNCCAQSTYFSFKAINVSILDISN